MATMQVESFECTETAHEPIEISREAADIIDRLGLKGQASFINAGDDNKAKSRCPYRLITAEEQAVYSFLCPQHVKIEDYEAAPIPMRVLQIAAHAREVIPDLRLYVWDKERAVFQDPVLIGESGPSNWWDTGFKRYILARWGTELDTFATLIEMATKLKRKHLISEAERTLTALKSATDADILLRS